jgi:uncharacterized protein (DUF305 family)
MKIKTILFSTIICASFSIGACNNVDKNVESNNMKGMDGPDMMKAMHSSMNGMDDMKMTGNFDCDFASMMIIHHQGAIDMSNVQLQNGTDADIKAMAQDIIKNQQTEIDKMHVLLNDLKINPEVEKSNKGEFSNDMKDMMKKMKGMSTTGNVDKDFVSMMIPHHEAAVKMAKDQVTYGKNEALKEMAQKMVADQNKEIDLFKKWLADQK